MIEVINPVTQKVETDQMIKELTDSFNLHDDLKNVTKKSCIEMLVEMGYKVEDIQSKKRNELLAMVFINKKYI